MKTKTAEALRLAVQSKGWAATESPTTADFIALAEGLGEIKPSRLGGPQVDELRPKRSSKASPRSLSGAHGLGRFPYHTDAAHHPVPPRFVLLRLASRARSTRKTLIAPIPRRLSKDDRRILEHDVWLVDGGRGRFLTSILGTPEDASASPLIRFDEGCMRPADTAFGVAREVILRLALERERVVEWTYGRVVVIDNWRTLHARDGCRAPNEDRVLERILVKQS